jgi:hypothetical protein
VPELLEYLAVIYSIFKSLLRLTSQSSSALLNFRPAQLFVYLSDKISELELGRIA